MLEHLTKFRRQAMRLVENRWLRSDVASIEVTDSSDIFLAGYPKSGNTWAQTLIAALYAGCDLGRTSDAVVQTLIPDINLKRYYQRWATPMVFKTHQRPEPRFRRVIHLIRDGRDAMVSYYHYNRATVGPAATLARMVQNGEHLYWGRWHDHAAAWAANPFNAEVLLLRYEALKEDSVRELRRIANFLGISVEDDTLGAIASAAQFEKMRVREAREGWADKAWSKEHSFVRRGVVGSYRDEFPEDLLETFEHQAARWLKHYGYAVGSDPRTMEVSRSKGP